MLCWLVDLNWISKVRRTTVRPANSLVTALGALRGVFFASAVAAVALSYPPQVHEVYVALLEEGARRYGDIIRAVIALSVLAISLFYLTHLSIAIAPRYRQRNIEAWSSLPRIVAYITAVIPLMAVGFGMRSALNYRPLSTAWSPLDKSVFVLALVTGIALFTFATHRERAQRVTAAMRRAICWDRGVLIALLAAWIPALSLTAILIAMPVAFPVSIGLVTTFCLFTICLAAIFAIT